MRNLDEQELQNKIEEFVDKHGLSKVIGSLAQMCFEKSEHIEASYADLDSLALSKDWYDAGELLSDLANTVEV